MAGRDFPVLFYCNKQGSLQVARSYRSTSATNSGLAAQIQSPMCPK